MAALGLLDGIPTRNPSTRPGNTVGELSGKKGLEHQVLSWTWFFFSTFTFWENEGYGGYSINAERYISMPCYMNRVFVGSFEILEGFGKIFNFLKTVKLLEMMPLVFGNVIY